MATQRTVVKGFSWAVAVAACCAATWWCAAGAWASEVTDVLDSAETDKPFGASLRLRFESDTRSSVIAREVKCLANDVSGKGLCPTSGIYLNKEATYSRTRNVMNIDARIGLYHDLEIYAYVPVVTSDSHEMAYASGVGPGNSTIFPAYDKDVLFRLPYASTKRAGLGDITLGLRWAPYNFYRDNTAPTVVMGVESVLPSGTVATASNDAVGQGLTRLRTYFTFSRRALTYLEPFFELHASMPFPSQDSLFQVNDPLGTQPFKTPAPSGGTRFGLTVIPWENVANDQRVELEGGMGLDYIGRGRDYTEVWEALANPTNPCRPDKDCANTSHWKSDNDPTTGQHTITNGIMDVQAYIRTQGWAALHYQPVRHFQISAKLNWLHETPHFISFGEYGKDLDGTQTVESQNKMKQNEYSPSFLPAIDTPGQRLRVLDANNLVFMIAVSGKL